MSFQICYLKIKNVSVQVLHEEPSGNFPILGILASISQLIPYAARELPISICQCLEIIGGVYRFLSKISKMLLSLEYPQIAPNC